MKSFLIFSLLSLSFEASALLKNPDPSLVDPKTSPCENFYQYACGKWISKAKIPSDLPFWDRGFISIAESNRATLKKILENYSEKRYLPENKYAFELGNLYASCMDKKSTERGSQETLNAEMKEIDGITKENLSSHIGWFHRHGMAVFFSFGKAQDFKNPQEVIAEFDQGGLGLPNKEYYLDSSDQMKELRGKYLLFLTNVLTKLGDQKSKTHALAVLSLETKLATSALSPVERRDTEKLYHRLTNNSVKELLPDLNFTDFFHELEINIPKSMNVAVPDALKAANAVIKETSLEDIKSYLKVRLVTFAGKALPRILLNEYFQFYGKNLYGLKKLPPQWKMCVDASNEMMGFALGKSFVDQTFQVSSKDQAGDLIRRIEEEQKHLIVGLSWMDMKTKKSALEKINKLSNKVGYPDQWKSYEGLKITRNSFLANKLEGSSYNVHYEDAKIGKPLDRTEWLMIPSEVNAYYNPQFNEMVFPAGILQPAFFSATYSSGANYGGIGMIMGHEISHGYDDQGKRFDADGAMKDWWTEESSKEFQKNAQCLAKQYDQYPVGGTTHVNGNLVLGEAIGDQGGIKLSFNAWKSNLSKIEDAAKMKDLEKEFFLSFAQAWCVKASDAFEQYQAKSDPHPLNRYRVNGTLRNFPEFARVFDCKEGLPMAPKDRCVVW